MDPQSQPDTYTKQLEKNIGKYSWFKIFTKRVYLPLITIQLVNEGGVTVDQLALIVIVTAIVYFILQLPTGYLADRYGNKFAILFGCTFTAFSPLIYIFMPNFWGGLCASLLYFGGFAFQSGAIEAFMHDTLVALKREKDYAKIMGRAQSYGLIGNVILVTAVPATYAINHSLPFILGTISVIIMWLLAASFTYPQNRTTSTRLSPILAVKSIVSVQNIAIFLFAGFMAGVSFRGGEYRELLLQDIGVAVALFGAVVAAGSALGAILGWHLHKLDTMPPRLFYLLDLSLIAGLFVLMGITRQPIIVIATSILFMGYNRVRMIVFQSKLLHEIQHAYKATLISSLNLFATVGEIVAISILTKAIGLTNYSTGHLLFGIAIFGIGFILWLGIVASEQHQAKPVA